MYSQASTITIQPGGGVAIGQPTYQQPQPMYQQPQPMYQQPMQQTGIYPSPQPIYAPQPIYHPQPQMAMSIPTTNVVVLSQGGVQRPPKDWNHSIFDCTSNMGACCIGCFFPCVMYGMNKKDLSHRSSCVGDCIMYALVASMGCGACVGGGGRTTMRARYNIRGDSCVDCLAHLCCHPCALTQERMELDENLAAGLN
ncbi:PLAC8 family-domain-containing protein [Phlyctochytrium arcticum]|nr:PLAC8 family-domain-containing protein [Phlyctochytrium arcticum]